MNSKDNKSKTARGLDSLKKLFSKSDDDVQSPVDDESNIPVLNESIPELNEKIVIDDNFSVSLDSTQSTETVEQQMARTHHEEEVDIPELVDTVPFKQNIILADSDLDQQQLDIEATALQEKSDHLELVTKPDMIDDSTDVDEIVNSTDETTDEIIPTVEDNHLTVEEIREKILEKTWEKTEGLLMSHLPPQMSGTYLTILDARIEEHKQQILEELTLLDMQSLEELFESLTAQDDKR